MQAHRIFTGAALAFALGCAGLIPELKPSDEKKQAYVDAHPGLRSDIRSAILAGSPQIGMAKADLIATIGKPQEINRTVNAYGTTEQWVYVIEAGRPCYWCPSYVYFDNDTVTSWQD